MLLAIATWCNFVLGGLSLCQTLPIGSFFHRHENPSNVTTRHAAYARQRLAALLLRVLHIWHRWSPTLGRDPQTALRNGPTAQRITTQVRFLLLLR